MVIDLESDSNYLIIYVVMIGMALLNVGISATQFFKAGLERKKATHILLIIAACFIPLAGFFKLFHIPGASIILILTCNFICFASGPLIVKNRYEKWKPFCKTWLSAFFLSLGDLIGVVSIIMGWLFKTQHWKGYSFLFALGSIILILVLFSWNSLFKKIVLRQKEIEINLSNKHKELSQAHQEITDSIDYAKRIQNAILPPSRLMNEYFKASFILYKPKDIVAGDFYWMEDLNDTILFAAADCTGHGVPGAMVSVVCHNALNRAVREFNLTEPGEILDKVRDLVVEEFEKSDDDVKDGMDIALCALNGSQLKYAGAHNPLWIIRQQEIIEIKANKQPIGKFYQPTSFQTHTFNLEMDDTIYIFSDGLVDQFGGEREKKFKPANLRKLLLSIQSQTLTDQKISISEAFDKWKGNLEQVDDVCMIGIRIN